MFNGELWRGRSNLAVSLRGPLTLRELPSVLVPVAQLAGTVLAVSAITLAGRAAVPIAAAGLLPMAVGPALRALRMSQVAGGFDARHFPANAAVAYVYDYARTLALVAFAGHGVRRR